MSSLYHAFSTYRREQTLERNNDSIFEGRLIGFMRKYGVIDWDLIRQSVHGSYIGKVQAYVSLYNDIV